MGRFAARKRSPHICPIHGPQQIAEGDASVLIEQLAAARKGDRFTCCAEIVDGTLSVLIGRQPIAREQHAAGCGGRIDKGCGTVIVGGMDGDADRIACLRELCRTDPLVLERARVAGSIKFRDIKEEDIGPHFEMGKLIGKKSKGSEPGHTQGRDILISRLTSCCELKRTLFHELVHVDQNDHPEKTGKWDNWQRERDAYEQTEQWTMDQCLPESEYGGASFRRGGEVDKSAIDAYVRGHYDRYPEPGEVTVTDGGPIDPNVDPNTYVPPPAPKAAPKAKARSGSRKTAQQLDEQPDKNVSADIKDALRCDCASDP